MRCVFEGRVLHLVHLRGGLHCGHDTQHFTLGPVQGKAFLIYSITNTLVLILYTLVPVEVKARSSILSVQSMVRHDPQYPRTS